MRSQKEIIKGCLEGNKASQFELVKRHSGMLMSVCRRYASNDAYAKDILQESWIKIFKNLAQCQKFDAVEAWMRTIAIRTAYHWNKKKQLHFELNPDEIANSQLLAPDIFSRFDEEEIIQLIQELPNGFRAIFSLNVIEGYSHREIAELLNISESTSRSQLVRARKVLQEKIIKKKVKVA